MSTDTKLIVGTTAIAIIFVLILPLVNTEIRQQVIDYITSVILHLR